MPNVEKLHDLYSTLVVECYKLKKGKVRGQQQDQTKRDFNKIVDALANKEPARDKAGDLFKKSLEEYVYSRTPHLRALPPPRPPAPAFWPSTDSVAARMATLLAEPSGGTSEEIADTPTPHQMSQRGEL